MINRILPFDFKKGIVTLTRKEFMNCCDLPCFNNHLVYEMWESTGTVENPVFKLYEVAAGNYNLAVINIENGKGRLVGSGVISEVKDPKYHDVEKAKCHIKLPDREIKGQMNDLLSYYKVETTNLSTGEKSTDYYDYILGSRLKKQEVSHLFDKAYNSFGVD